LDYSPRQHFGSPKRENESARPPAPVARHTHVATAYRRITDGLRRRTRRRARETLLNPKHETFAAPQANLEGAEADSRALMDEIEKLPSGQRQALRLLKLEQRSLKEAAAASGQSIGSLKVASHRAMRSLRRAFARRGHET